MLLSPSLPPCLPPSLSSCLFACQPAFLFCPIHTHPHPQPLARSLARARALSLCLSLSLAESLALPGRQAGRQAGSLTHRLLLSLLLTAEVAKGPDVSGVQFEGLPVPLLRRSVIPLPPQLSSQEVEKGRRRRRRRRMRMKRRRTEEDRVTSKSCERINNALSLLQKDASPFGVHVSVTDAAYGWSLADGQTLAESYEPPSSVHHFLTRGLDRQSSSHSSVCRSLTRLSVELSLVQFTLALSRVSNSPTSKRERVSFTSKYFSAPSAYRRSTSAAVSAEI